MFALAGRRLPAAALLARPVRRPPIILRQAFFSEASGEAKPEATLAELEARAAELRQQIEDLDEKRATSVQETDQARKRHPTDLENESKFGITKFAREAIKIVDNLERASSSVKKEDLDEDPELKTMHKGVTELSEAASKMLGEFGITKMESLDQQFDPEHHEAMFVMEMPGKEPNTIFHVMEPGYMIHSRTLRAARVGVVKGAA
mmetsp:Transcript_3894/g.9068  ORF Transcript_3894/g.9068 Transcript_3894/m.9068 type:complete len:205 (-) Transcript_3894:87-701(-)